MIEADKSLELLQEALGEEAQFHPYQYEAIESILNLRRTLVVQKTGWGKSVVYFITTKIFREQGKGVTILICPLISLMRNQVKSAARFGLVAETINSENTDDWERIFESLLRDECDILLVSPEKLSDIHFRQILSEIPLGIGLFVVDEAHCISNWGHDFRLDYKRIVSIVENLPSNVPVLATTATANDRVVKDIQKQLGHDLHTIRGPLIRESLRIQTINMYSQAEKLAWLASNIPNFKGSGIIYCLTTSDCKKVTNWLRFKGVNAQAYYGDVSKYENTERAVLEQRLIENKYKVLVATDALGMGFDKSDISFVIHFQIPGSVIAYYQQIGRAGRGLSEATAILLTGPEDEKIQEYFIKSAFPSEEIIEIVLNIIEESEKSISVYGILKECNISQRKVEQCIKLLELERIISKEGSGYIRTPVEWLRINNADEVTKQRYVEMERMRYLKQTQDCYMEFISKELDDHTAEPCGRCANCLGGEIVPSTVTEVQIAESIHFLNEQFLSIKVKKQWPLGGVGNLKGRINVDIQNAEGRSLSLYGDSGWGELVKEDRYLNGEFRIELVKAAAEFIRQKWNPEQPIEWITAIPSIRHESLVKDFATKLAHELNLPFHEQIIKTQHTEEQKNMRNSSMQVRNIADSFVVNKPCPSGNVLLVDDIMNSGWTFTMCGYLLKMAGSGVVYPFALASTASGSDII
ncbi:RecQ family ATP-dependent DNA helicase [Paenibacillus taichungensis]|uniref:RecQ family ATP-dependent DNA helicase n=1 Tax=Paenibacillus taichungensis TaxID=484184 RepID=UPI002DBCCD9A|nr:RecQ family ATP-dependent DNA helicase [Paenibacillus taichungensis]MEC0108676.1 RecQ family ATP-dependent DNA helicase [Paenibacillus taichungensis]MEC0196176.1 RecQ family ATP-dependent DNA helicase [Paenibacillus taichungensis]